MEIKKSLFVFRANRPLGQETSYDLKKKETIAATAKIRNKAAAVFFPFLASLFNAKIHDFPSCPFFTKKTIRKNRLTIRQTIAAPIAIPKNINEGMAIMNRLKKVNNLGVTKKFFFIKLFYPLSEGFFKGN
jgi:hypothetical protein